ncbi:MAG: tRNA (N(6)-L-threonylcarbamoyladenosine(37)-C(2))-methylthiotransferase MtaB [Alphaproteobacteria bacterium]|nr:tRNA (N(6)-L-threonylcarbamoyladenosine(37)-C(2))-methylthiotransferase MtaB [Alphaproteobacteria bacterium]
MSTAPGNPVEIVTFGCRLNAYESEAMKGRAAEAGLGDAVIVNTCAVTNEAVRQARQTIRKLKREAPERAIIVTGCAAQTEPGTFADMPEVARVIGNAEKMTVSAYAFDAAHERVRVNDIFELKETGAHLIDGFGDRARAFVQVQNGCDHRCTFCIIPYGRGNSRSVPMGDVVEQVRRLARNGTAEVVLTGVDITSFGADLPGTPKLGDLVQKILKLVPELKRLRLSSLDAVEADPALLRAIAEEERLMPHLHVSLQAGDDMILKRMKRRHSRADAIRFCAELRRLRPDVAFGADLIAGFPTETDAMFANTLDLVDECGLAYLHVFPFSPRKGTPAARMPQLGAGIAKARAAELRAAGDAALARHLKRHEGTMQDVLIEKPGFGRLKDFSPVAFTGPGGAGDIVPMTIAEAGQRILTADTGARAAA